MGLIDDDDDVAPVGEQGIFLPLSKRNFWIRVKTSRLFRPEEIAHLGANL